MSRGAINKRRFLSTPSARRATHRPPPIIAKNRISIHALREEGDKPRCAKIVIRVYFYPRPPRGGRHSRCTSCTAQPNFYPRPPRGGRPRVYFIAQRPANFYPRPPRGGRLRYSIQFTPFLKFLSTPSARRATFCSRFCARSYVISIHALREEGDFCRGYLPSAEDNFYPRPPRGGRPIAYF